MVKFINCETEISYTPEEFAIQAKKDLLGYVIQLDSVHTDEINDYHFIYFLDNKE